VGGEEKIVCPRGCDLQCTPGRLLAFDLREVYSSGLEAIRPCWLGRLQGPDVQQVLYSLRQTGDTDRRHVLERRRLARVGRRNQHLGHSQAAAQIGYRQSTTDGPDGAVEPQLPTDEAVREHFARNDLVSREQRQSDRQIEVTALLAQIRRRQIEHGGALRDREAAVLDCGLDALTAFANCRVRQPDDVKARQAISEIYLDFYLMGIDAPGRRGPSPSQHTFGDVFARPDLALCTLSRTRLSAILHLGWAGGSLDVNEAPRM